MRQPRRAFTLPRLSAAAAGRITVPLIAFIGNMNPFFEKVLGDSGQAQQVLVRVWIDAAEVVADSAYMH